MNILHAPTSSNVIELSLMSVSSVKEVAERFGRWFADYDVISEDINIQTNPLTTTINGLNSEFLKYLATLQSAV